MINPGDESRIDSETDSMPWGGYAFGGGHEMRLRAKNAAGGFDIVATTRSATTALTMADGSRLYPFTTRATVPAAYWTPVAGCRSSAAWLKGGELSGSTEFPILAFDPASANCFTTMLGFGATNLEAAACTTADPIRVYAGPGETVTRDVTISSRAAADALRCTTRIVGNLRVETLESGIALPQLGEITGNLEIVGQFSVASGSPAVPRVNLDLLTRVGGSVMLRVLRLPGAPSVPPVDFGLPRLGYVNGDVTIELNQFNAQPDGLNRLARIGRNLTLTTTESSELYAGELLQRLLRVDGSVTIRSGHNSGNLFPKLRHVDGSVLIGGTSGRIRPYLHPSVLPELQHVGGNMTLEADRYHGIMPRLGHVAGRLTIDGAYLSSTPAITATNLRVGSGITVRGTELSAFPLRAAPGTQLLGGTLEVTSNPNLCDSVIAAFAASQRPLWTGALVSAANRGGC